MSQPAPKPTSELNKENSFRFFQRKEHQIMVGIVTAIAAYGLMRKGNWRAAMRLYPSGGGGFNIYKIQPSGNYHRRFALDYHPVWNKQTRKHEWLPHYHLGKNFNQAKKHRPHEGGWFPPS